jgi:hypothetical protein
MARSNATRQRCGRLRLHLCTPCAAACFTVESQPPGRPTPRAQILGGFRGGRRAASAPPRHSSDATLNDPFNPDHPAGRGLARGLRRGRRGARLPLPRQLPAGRRLSLPARALGVDVPGPLRERLGAPALHVSLRLPGATRLRGRAPVQCAHRARRRVADVAARGRFEDRARGTGRAADLLAAVVLHPRARPADRAALRARLRRRAAAAPEGAGEGGDGGGVADDPRAARRVLPRRAVGRVGAL